MSACAYRVARFSVFSRFIDAFFNSSLRSKTPITNMLTQEDLKQISSLRAIIEGFGAKHAAARAAQNPEQISRLGETLQRLNAALRRRDYPAFRAADSELHETIMIAAQMPMLREIWQTVWSALLDFHRRGFDECTPDPRVLIGEHEHLIETIAMGDPIAAEDAAKCHAQANWFRFGKDNEKQKPRGSGPFHLAVAHVNYHLHCPLRLNEVATKIAFTSPGNLSRLFRRHCGRSFNRYVQKLRMEKAAELLKTTKLPINTVARRVGYRDVSRFGRHFRTQFRELPSQWRRRKISDS